MEERDKESSNSVPTSERTDLDSRYYFDDAKLFSLKNECPWISEAKYFKSVAISPSAIVKMVSFRSDDLTNAFVHERGL
jgi:hypothetical protein